MDKKEKDLETQSIERVIGFLSIEIRLEKARGGANSAREITELLTQWAECYGYYKCDVCREWVDHLTYCDDQGNENCNACLEDRADEE